MTARELELELFNTFSNNPVIIKDVQLKSFYDHIIFAFNGSITYNTLMFVSLSLRDELKNNEGTDKEHFNVYYVFMELIQNIMNYSINKDEDRRVGGGTCFVIYNKANKIFRVSSGNIISTKSSDHIIEKIDKINELDIQKLKLYYKEMRKSGKDRHNKGVGLGFIEMARKSSKKLDYKITELDSVKSYFEINVYI
jgi:hypothetical protein